ncbi:MAG: hypothetical protein ABIT38_16525, partial [Gemmatimonadaceae bacterium]
DTQPDRHKRSEALIALITDDGFQQAHRTVLRDPVSLRSDFERAVATAAADDHLAAPPLVVRAALAYHALRRADTHPGELFDLARAGDVEGAERRLAMFPADQGWRQCVSLTIAWLAGSQNLAASKAVRDRVVGQGLEPELQLLVARMNADLFQGEAPQLPPLPYPPQESHVIELVQRLMGNAVTGIEPLDLTSMQEHLNAKSPGANADAAPAYLAEVDGPILISHVCDRKDEAANALFARYVAVHASNGYEYYRNRSLWALISPVLSHPDSHWVREQLVVLGSGALSASPVRFVEALPLTVLALLAKLGDVPATSEYEEARDTARKNAAGITSTRGGDPWAYTLRRLVALAEIEAVAHGRPSVATALVSEALALPYGFAGFSSMGRLTLSDMLRIVAPADVASFTAATAAALESAHNVQDFIFCAQATSRVGAVCSWWRETQPNDALPDLVKTLACDRDDPRFAARHVVGEQFARRGKGAQKLPIPDWARSARTIQTLARLYVRPLADFVRHSLEAGHKANDDLPLGFEVRVPDPSFAEMMAARFSADCLASGLPKGKMTRL